MIEKPIVDDEVPVIFIKKIVDLARSLGFPVDQLLVEKGLSGEFLSNKRNQITNQLQRDLISIFVKKINRPDFAFRVGKRMFILDWGMLGYAFISSANMRSAWETYSTYQRLIGPLVNLYCREQGEEAVLIAVEAFPLGDLYRFAIEEWLAETRASFDKLDMVNMEFSEVRVAYSQPAHADMYRNLFDCPVKFDQPGNEIRFPREILNAPFNMADEDVAELCIRQCAEVMKHLSEEDPAVDAVRRVLLSKPGLTPTLGRVADCLHISSRTLRRRLHEAGTSYKAILSDIRLGLAAEYLRSTQMLPKEIAYMLGYSCVTSFHRAFKNRYQMTPVIYREQRAEFAPP